MAFILSGDPSFIITFDTDEDVDYFNPDLSQASATGTLAGGATVSGGRLEIDGVAGSGADYDKDLMDGVLSEGCLRMKLRFHALPDPGEEVDAYLFHASLDNDGFVEGVVLKLTATGNLRAVIEGITVLDQPFVPVLEQDYVLEYNFLLSTGACEHRLFVDGVQLGPTSTEEHQAFASDAFLGLRVGAHRVDGAVPSVLDAGIDYVAVFPTVQHTTSHTPNPSFPQRIMDPVTLASVDRGLITYSQTKGRYRPCGRNS